MTTSIQIISDAHTEFGMSVESFRKLLKPADITILAGDIVDDPAELPKYLQVVKEFSKYVLYVPGNHEYYQGYRDDHYENVITSLNEENIFFLQKQRIVINGIGFCGATLWTNVTLTAYNLMNDNHSIEDIRLLHQEHKNWLEENIQKGDIVITHHLPSLKLIHPKYHGNPATSGFATDLDYMIENLKPSFWICGHTHEPFDISISDTRIIINPVGYPNERRSFTPKIINV